ncbi:MAG: hypothetical protein EU541_00305 [Promethearchaeota archaeon]|nr:MAG: hypothetical protein EU541_00305 [Candidatus Lokiarchaeota archaeon]
MNQQNNLQSQISQAKNKRDELNQKTKDYIKSLQEVETEIQEALDQAKQLKEKRNRWNERVAKLKDKKIEYKNLLSDLISENKQLGGNRRQREADYISGKKIDKKIENLERQIETENLTIAEENDIVNQIQELAQKKKELLEVDTNQEVLKNEKKIEIVKINLDKIYEQLNKWSNKSQKYHKRMLEQYDKVDELKEKKNNIEEGLIENKKKADDYHEKFIQLRRKQKKTSGGRPSSRRKSRRRYHKKRDKELEKIKQDKLETALKKQKEGKKLNIYEARLILEKNKQ